MNKNTHIKDLSKKLQEEVDLILTNVDEKTLFAEFREDQMIDLKGDGTQEVVRTSLDERIFLDLSHRHKRSHKPLTVKNNVKSLPGSLYNIFFKPI